ncbi:MAG: NAD-dependent epimerase/dehydratase family protein [Planctomycetota bacterium]
MRVLVTGATGLVGGQIFRSLHRRGCVTRVLLRRAADSAPFATAGAECAFGDMTDAVALSEAVAGVDAVVHCAAKVGDWGPVEAYREVNVRGTAKLLELAAVAGVRRLVHVGSLGVYEARDHDGTDETVAPNAAGIDGYTRSKVESERLVVAAAERGEVPAVVLRPGFVYGPGDRTVLPRLVASIAAGKFAFLGPGTQRLNNTGVENFATAVGRALFTDDPDGLRDDLVGEVFNVTDDRLVTRLEFVETVARLAGLPTPTRHVPLAVAKPLASAMEATYRLLGRTEAPLLSAARVKFLGLDLAFSIEKAKRELGYAPAVPFETEMTRAVAWCRDAGLIPAAGGDRTEGSRAA